MFPMTSRVSTATFCLPACAAEPRRTITAATATTVVNMRLVEDQVVLIGKGYMPLALEAKDLSRSQDDLWSELETMKPEAGLDTRRSRIKKLRRDRNRNIENIRKILDELDRV